MIDSEAFIIIALLVVFGFIGLVAWFVDQGAASKYRRVVLYGLFAALASVFGLFFLIEDDSDFEYAGPGDYAQNDTPEQSGESPFGEGGDDDGGGAGGGKGGDGEAGDMGGGEGDAADAGDIEGGGEMDGEADEIKGEGDLAGGEDLDGDGKPDGEGGVAAGEGDEGGAGDNAKDVAAAEQDGDAGKDGDNKDANKCEDCPEIVVVLPGQALLGSPALVEAGGARTGPSTTLQIDKAFGIGKHEVTVGQFRKFIDATGYEPSRRCRQVGTRNTRATWLTPGFEQTDKHPVVCVSWADATNYVLWLSKISGHRYRLPTEVEWEYAARAGVSDAYLSGKTIEPGLANFDASRGTQKVVGTQPVGQFPANRFGVHDVHGNVWEMVRDCWAASYEVANAAPVNKTESVKDCKKRVIKGGGWFSSAKQLNFAMRIGVVMKFASNGVGFRVVREDI